MYKNGQSCFEIEGLFPFNLKKSKSTQGVKQKLKDLSFCFLEFSFNFVYKLFPSKN